MAKNTASEQDNPSTSSGQASSGMSAMAQLLAKQKDKFVTFNRGDAIKGTITKLTRSEILVDIKAKTEALVLEKDKRILNSLIKMCNLGDEVTVTILNPESDMGNPIVSLRRFLEDKAWSQLEEKQKNQEQVEVTVTEVTKGGHVVTTDTGLSGFLPHSHTSASANQQISIGKTLPVSILEINRQDNKLIVSQKSIVSAEDFTKAVKDLKTGSKIKATITNVTPFGIFVAVPGRDEKTIIDGLIHISELSWEKTTEIPDTYKAGESIEAVIFGFDTNARRIDLSLKRLTADPFDEISKKYAVDTKVTGTVVKLSDGNVIVDLGEEIEGTIRKEKVPPTKSYAVGDTVQVTVSEIDTRRRRIELVPVLLEKPIGYR